MDDGSISTAASLVDRAKGIILKPKEEWPRIEAETTSQTDILKGYVLPLAVIAPVAAFLGGQIFGYGILGISWKPSFMSALLQGIVSFLLTIVGLFALAWIADFLATKFDGKSNNLNAFKLVAYGATASFLAGIFGLIPSLAFFSLLGLYSLYLFYTGANPLMKVPQEKTVGYTAVTFLCAIVLFIVIGLVAGRLIGQPGASIVSESRSDSGKITIPGVGTIDTKEMEEAAERMEKVQRGEIKAVPIDTLKGMLPAMIGSFERTGTSTQSLGQAGAMVEGKYNTGDYQFDLEVRDMPSLMGMAGLAGVAAALGGEHTREDENGYERVGMSDGEWRKEKWNNSGSTGRYGILVADRFQVEASGHVESIDVLKAAVAAIDADDLEDMAE